MTVLKKLKNKVEQFIFRELEQQKRQREKLDFSKQQMEFQFAEDQRALAKQLAQDRKQAKKKLQKQEDRIAEELQQKESLLGEQVAKIVQASQTAHGDVEAYAQLAQVQQDAALRAVDLACSAQQANLAALIRSGDMALTKEGTCSPRVLLSPWEDHSWSVPGDSRSYSPSLVGSPPEVVRLGNLLVEQAEPPYSVPAIGSIRSLDIFPHEAQPGHVVIFSHDKVTRSAAVDALQSLALRILATAPVKQVRATFIDPTGMGNNFLFPYKDLEVICGLQAYTSSDNIREQLKTLIRHIELVIRDYLGVTYKTLEDFNAANPLTKEPYRYLFIADFPDKFDNTSWEYLKSLLNNGAKTGVYVIAHIDESLERPRSFDYGSFERNCTVVRPSGSMSGERPVFQVQQVNHSFRLLLDQPPLGTQFGQITAALAESLKKVKSETIPFSRYFPSDPWSGGYDSRQEIRAPIGVTGATDQLQFWLGQNTEGAKEKVASSGLLAGKPGSGKSYTLRAIVLSLALRYPPDELEMYLLDYKEGVEFQVYVDPDRAESTDEDLELDETKALPHARVISIESDREFGLHVLKAVQQQMEERAVEFKKYGADKLKTYRDNSGKKLSRVLVIIDEFQYLFKESDALSRELSSIFEDITRRGRAFGIHLLIASQSPNVPNMSSAIYSYIDLRMAMLMDARTANHVLADGNADSVSLLESPGEIIYNDHLGQSGFNTLGRVADVSFGLTREVLSQLREIATARGFNRSKSLTVYNGTQPGKLKRNTKLAQLSAMPHWLSLRELNQQVICDPDWDEEEVPRVTWLGESMKIGEHTQATFRQSARHNFLMVGGAETMAYGIFGGVILSLVHTCLPQTAAFRVIDMARSDDETHPWGNLSLDCRQGFSGNFEFAIAKRYPKPEQEILHPSEILTKVFEELETRKQQSKANPYQRDFGPSIFFFWMFGKLDRAPTLEPVIEREREKPSPDTQKLFTLLAQGPEVGIHTTLWVESMMSFNRVFGDSARSCLTNFRLRVAFSKEDLKAVVGEADSGEPKKLLAYFVDNSSSSKFEKFKPYAVPSQWEIQEYVKQLKRRSI